jgi:hypothetical protein
VDPALCGSLQLFTTISGLAHVRGHAPHELLHDRQPPLPVQNSAWVSLDVLDGLDSLGASGVRTAGVTKDSSQCLRWLPRKTPSRRRDTLQSPGRLGPCGSSRLSARFRAFSGAVPRTYLRGRPLAGARAVARERAWGTLCCAPRSRCLSVARGSVQPWEAAFTRLSSTGSPRCSYDLGPVFFSHCRPTVV